MQYFELETAEVVTPIDPLATMESSSGEWVDLTQLVETPPIPCDPLETIQELVMAEQKTPTLQANILEKLKFLVHYLAVSTVVFVILLVSTNWSAYWAIAVNLVNPGALKASGIEMAESLGKSKITVFANADGWAENVETNKETAESLKKQLTASNIQIQEDPFSMKHLLPSEPNIQVGFDITPYENRIIIPKIGKNIPLVDIVGANDFDFDHMENIFMQELEKGVVRYPGSALPGESGNSFIFGHSSNYPWIKGNYNDIFALLDDLESGDQIIVYYNQKKFVYIVQEKKIVKPGDVKALSRDPAKKELSLMTCWPVGTTLKRMLVFAELDETSTVH